MQRSIGLGFLLQGKHLNIAKSENIQPCQITFGSVEFRGGEVKMVLAQTR